VDAGQEGAVFGFVWDDGAGVDGGFGYVESEVGLSFGCILSVAVEAVFGEDGSDIAIEIRGWGLLGVGLQWVQECSESEQEQHSVQWAQGVE
jgi:hypothetical protein